MLHCIACRWNETLASCLTMTMSWEKLGERSCVPTWLIDRMESLDLKESELLRNRALKNLRIVIALGTTTCASPFDNGSLRNARPSKSNTTLPFGSPPPG